MLDFGGGTLSTLAGLPHVGGVASRLQGDRVRRTVAEVRARLEQREREFGRLGIDSIATYRALRADGAIPGDGFGDVFLVVDGWLILRQEYEQLELDITALAARGLGYGIHVVAATNKWSEFRPAIRDLLGTRFELRLVTRTSRRWAARLAANIPERSPGRGLTRDGLHFLTRAAAHRRPARRLQPGRRRAQADRATSPPHGRRPRAPEVRLLPVDLPVGGTARPGRDRHPAAVRRGRGHALAGIPRFRG